VDARLLRSLVHAQYGIPLPAPSVPPPRGITLQRKSSNRRLLNEGEVVQMLAEFGEVRGQARLPAVGLCCLPGAANTGTSGMHLYTLHSPSHCLQVQVVEYRADSSFREQLEVLAGTGALISVHTSNLANALFLPPGAAVFEILQRNWAWEGAHGGSSLHNSKHS
jgi:protein O-GlcNAc transferase